MILHVAPSRIKIAAYYVWSIWFVPVVSQLKVYEIHVTSLDVIRRTITSLQQNSLT